MPDPKRLIVPADAAKEALFFKKTREDFETILKDRGVDQKTLEASLAAYDEQSKKKSSSESSTAKVSTVSTSVPATKESQESGDSDYLSKKRDLKNRLDFADVFTSSTNGDIFTSVQSIDELNRLKKAAQEVPLIEEETDATVRQQAPEPSPFVRQQLEAAGQRSQTNIAPTPVQYNEAAERENIKFIRENIQTIADTDEATTIEEKFEANKELILEANQKTLAQNREKLNQSFKDITGSSDELVKSDENGRLFIDERSFTQADLISQAAIAEQNKEMMGNITKGIIASSAGMPGMANPLAASAMNGVARMYYGVGAWFGGEEAAYRLEDLNQENIGIRQAAGVSNDKVTYNGEVRKVSEMGISEIIEGVASGQIDEKYLADAAVLSSLSVAENLPQIAMTVGTGFVGGGAGLLLRGASGAAKGVSIGQKVGMFTLGAASGGQTWAETYGKGEDYALSLAYSLTDFAAEVVSESIFKGFDTESSTKILNFFKDGGAGKFGKYVSDSKVLNRLASQGYKAIASGFEEGTEEVITSLISQGVRKAVEGKEMNPYEIADSFILGFASGGATSAAMSTFNNSATLLAYGASKIPYKAFSSVVELEQTRKGLAEELSSASTQARRMEIQSLIEDIDLQIENKQRQKIAFYNSFSTEDAKKTVELNQNMRNLADKIKKAKGELDAGLLEAQYSNPEKIKKWTAELRTLATEWTEIHEKYDSQTQQQVPSDVQSGQVVGEISDQASSVEATQAGGDVQASEEIDFGGQESISFNGESIDDLNARIEATQSDSKASSLLTSIRNSISALKSVGKDSNVIIHKTLDAMASATGLTKSQVAGRAGMYNTKNGEVHVFLPLAKNNTTYHEVLHKIGESVDSKFQERFVASVINGLKSNAALAEKYGAFISNYEGGKLKTHELFTEIMSDIAAGNVEIKSVTPSLIQEIKKFFAELFGIDANYTDADLARYMNELASTLGAGGDIAVIAEKLNGQGFVFSEDFDGEDGFLNSLEFNDNDNSNKPRVPKGIKKETIKSILAKSDGKFALINSDPTGYRKQDLLGKTVALLGGIGYSFVPKNIKDGVGFASTQTAKVFSVLRGAYATSGGKNIPVFVLTNSMKSLFGNYYAMDYLANALKSAFDNGLTQEEYESTIREIISKIKLNEDEDTDVEKTKKKSSSVPKKSKEQIQQEIFDAIKDFNIANFIAIAKKDNTPLSFNVRNKMFESLLPSDSNTAKRNVISEKIDRSKFNQDNFVSNISEEHLLDTIKQNALNGGVFSGIVKKDGTISFAEMAKRNLGTIQSGFYFDFENPKSINSKYINKILELEEKYRKPWSKVNPKAKAKLYSEYESETGAKGIKHPQFNAKFMGVNPFILDGSYHFPSLYNNPEELSKNFNTVSGKSAETIVYVYNNKEGFKKDSNGNKIFDKNGIINAISQSIYILSSGGTMPDSNTLKSAKISDASKLIDMVSRMGVYEFYLDQVEREMSRSVETEIPSTASPSDFLSQYSKEYTPEGSKAYNDAFNFAKTTDIAFSGEPMYVVRDNGKVVAALFVDFAGDQFSFDVEVSKDHRRNGIASDLVREAIREYETLKDVIEDLEWNVNVVSEDMKNLLEGRFGFKTKPYAEGRWIAYDRNPFLYQSSQTVSDVALMIKNGMSKEVIVDYFMQFDNMLKEDAEFLYEHGLAKSQRRPISQSVVAEHNRKSAWKYKFGDKRAQDIVDSAKELIQRFTSGEITATKMIELMSEMAAEATEGKLKQKDVAKFVSGMFKSSDFGKSNQATQDAIIESTAQALAQIVDQTNAENNNKLTAHVKNIDIAKKKIKELVLKVNKASKSPLGIAGMRIPKAFSNYKIVQKFSTIDVNFLSPEMLVEFLNDVAILEARLSENRFKKDKDTGKYEITNPYVDQVTRSGEVIKVDMRKGNTYLNDRFGIYNTEVLQKKTFILYDQAVELVKERRAKGDENINVVDAMRLLAGRESMRARSARIQKKMNKIAEEKRVDINTPEGFEAVIQEMNAQENEVKQEKKAALINQIADNVLSFYGYLLTDKYMRSIFGIKWEDVTDPYAESYKGGEVVKQRIVNRMNRLSYGALAQIDYAINDLMANYSRAGLATLEARVRAEIDGNDKLKKLGVKSSKKNMGSKVLDAFSNKQTLFRRFFSNYSTQKIVEVLDALGINQLDVAVTAADAQYQAVKRSVERGVKIVKEKYGTDFDTVKNNTIAQIYTILRQKPENVSVQEWYNSVYKKVKQTVDYYESKKYDFDNQYSAGQIEEMYEAFKLAFDISYISDPDLDSIEKALQNMRARVDGVEYYVDYMARIHSQFTEPLAYYTETVLGKELKVEDNYTPFRFRNMSSGSNILSHMNDVKSVEDTLKNMTLAGIGKGPGSVVSRQDYSMNNENNMLDLNFKGINLNSLQETLFSINAGAQIAYVDQITKEPKSGTDNEFSRAIPDESARKLFRRSLVMYLSDIKTKQEQYMTPTIRNGIKFLRSTAAVWAFGSVAAQVVKQSSVVLASIAKMDVKSSVSTIIKVGELAARSLKDGISESAGIGISDGDYGLISNSSVLLRDTDEGFFNPMSEEYSFKSSSKLNKSLATVREKGVEISLFSMRKTDKIVAVASWLGFYESYLRKEGILKANEEFDSSKEKDAPNEKAIAYANAMVTRDHNQSSKRDMAVGLKAIRRSSVNSLIYGIVIPYASFAINKKINTATDIKTILSKDSEKDAKKEAARALTGTVAESIVFGIVANVVLPAIYESIAGLFGDDEEEKGKLDNYSVMSVIRRLLIDLNPYLPPVGAIEEGYINAIDKARYILSSYMDDKDYYFADEDMMDGYERWRVLHGLPTYGKAANGEESILSSMGVVGSPLVTFKNSFRNLVSFIDENKITSASGKEYYIRESDKASVAVGLTLEFITSTAAFFGFGAQEAKGIAKALQSPAKARALNEGEKMAELMLAQLNGGKEDFSFIEDKVKLYIQGQNFSAAEGMESKLEEGATKLMVESILKQEHNGNKFIKDLRVLDKVEDTGRGLGVLVDDILSEYDNEDDRRKFIMSSIVYFGAQSESKAGFMAYYLIGRGWQDEIGAEE